jgi:hypothetical protein
MERLSVSFTSEVLKFRFYNDVSNVPRGIKLPYFISIEICLKRIAI